MCFVGPPDSCSSFLLPPMFSEFVSFYDLQSCIYGNYFRHVNSAFLQKRFVFASVRHFGELSTRKDFKFEPRILCVTELM